ncbi:MAG: hypothetical protein HGB04_06680 [Chlorobiaceae bacterium]|nr:hypothetical protein [Chlorobiaceae bacterium]
MTMRVGEVTLFGHRCLVEQKSRYVVLTVLRPRCEITGSSIEEAALLFWRRLHAKPRLMHDAKGIEADIREALKLMRLPKRAVPVTGRHVIISKTGGRERYQVRRTMDGNGRTKLYFGSYATRHAAALASCRLCEIINKEIDARRAALLSVKI